MSDLELLQRHVRERDPRAFEEIVARHLDWVYWSALRQVRDPHTADDVTQAVFLALSQRAEKLAGGVVLSAWLFRVTRRAAAMALRSAGRRRKHERRAAMMADEERAATMDQQQWEAMAPVLDEVVGKLGAKDRQSILLRYFQRKSFAEVGAELAIGEAAARKRVSRAVGRMREMIEDKAVAVAAGPLAAGLLDNTTRAAPAETAAAVAANLATPAAASATVVSLTRGVLNMMRWTNVRIGAGAGLLVLAVVGLSIGVAQVAGPGKADAGGDKPAAAAAKPAAPAKPAIPAIPAIPAPDSPKGVVLAAYRAGLAGDADGMLGAFTGLTADQEATLRRTVTILSSVYELQTAVATKFGDKVGKQFGALGSGVNAADVIDAPEKIEGDRAVVDMGPSGPGEVPLVRVNGAWKVSAEVLRTLNANSVAQWEQKAPAIKQLAADIAAGKYPTLADLQKAVGGMMR